MLSSSYLNFIFDLKWNADAVDYPVGESYENSHPPGPSGGGSQPNAGSNGYQKHVRAPYGTMLLVIGIILVAVVAMFWIIKIVLRYQTGTAVERIAMAKSEDSEGNVLHSYVPPNQDQENSNAPRCKLAHPNDYGGLEVAVGENCEKYV